MNYKNKGNQGKDVKKFTIKAMLLIVASFGMLAASAAFTQGHPVSQIFTANNNPFSQCQQGQVLTSQGNCITPSTGSGSGTMNGNLDMGGNSIVGLNSIGGTSGECGINQPCPSTVRAEDIKANNELCLDRPYSIDSDHQITNNECISDVKLTDLGSGGQSSGDGYIGDSATANSPHVAGGPVDMAGYKIFTSGADTMIEDPVIGSHLNANGYNLYSVGELNTNGGSGTDIADSGDQTVSVGNNVNMENNQIENVASPNDPQDVATKEYVDSQTGSSGGDGYLPEDTATSDVNLGGNNIVDSFKIDVQKLHSGNGGKITSQDSFSMNSNDILNVDEIKAGSDTQTYMGGFGFDFYSGGIQFYDKDGQVRFLVDDQGVQVAGRLEMNGHDINNVGSCSSCDLAETVEKGENADLEKGDVVTINENGKLVKASKKYDSSVAGVVSSSPVIMMGSKGGGVDFGDNIAKGKSAVIETEEGKKEVPLALAGLVPVKASASNGAIEPGDKLTTSSISGYAVKAEPVMTSNGRKVYGSGIIGKAMESLESGKGKVKMLVSVE